MESVRISGMAVGDLRGISIPVSDARLVRLSEVFSLKCGESLRMGFVLAFGLWHLAFGQFGEGPPVISF